MGFYGRKRLADAGYDVFATDAHLGISTRSNKKERKVGMKKLLIALVIIAAVVFGGLKFNANKVEEKYNEA